MFERAFGFEQRRNVDPVLDPEQAREIERGEHGRGLLAFGDQHADRGIAVDMLEDLRHREELADGGAAFDRKACEVGALRLGIRQQIAQRSHRATAGKVDFLIVEFAPDGVVKLLGVHAEMDPAHAEAIGAHRGGQRAKRDRLFRLCPARIGFQLLDQRFEREQLVLLVLRHPVCGGGQLGRVGQIASEALRKGLGPDLCGLERAQQRMIGIDAIKCVGIALQPLRLFRQAERDRGVPGDVGPPVHVVPDPGGKAERQRIELLPAIGPALLRRPKDSCDDHVARILRMRHRRHCAFVFVAQGNLGRLGALVARRGFAR